MMDPVDLIRGLQAVPMALAAFASFLFLLRYRSVWDLSSPFSRYVFSINSLLILIVVFFLLSRFLPETLGVELARLLLFIGLIGVMGSQLYLMEKQNELENSNSD